MWEIEEIPDSALLYISDLMNMGNIDTKVGNWR
jgi:hypothetical protein